MDGGGRWRRVKRRACVRRGGACVRLWHQKSLHARIFTAVLRLTSSMTH